MTSCGLLEYTSLPFLYQTPPEQSWRLVGRTAKHALNLLRMQCVDYSSGGFSPGKQHKAYKQTYSRPQGFLIFDYRFHGDNWVHLVWHFKSKSSG